MNLQKMAFFLVFACLCVFAFPAAGENASLPLSFAPGPAPQEQYYLSATEYQDPTLHVTIEQGRAYDSDYWVARIQVGDASQLRTAAPDQFQYGATSKVEYLAKNNRAVLAINGDYWSYTDYGFFVRQGSLIMNYLYRAEHPDEKKRDVLMIDAAGDFHVFHTPLRGELDYLISGNKVMLDGKQVYNAFCFGPVLVENGEIAPMTATGEWMAPDDLKQRMCIAQTGPLEYMCICCAKSLPHSQGMTLAQMAELAKELGAQTAYNLDGGDSTAMIFHGKKINEAENSNTRDVSDIIYFATAYR